MNILKRRIKKPARNNEELLQQATFDIIKTEQKIRFPEVFEYLESNQKCKKHMPELISSLNVFVDPNGVLRIKSKLTDKTVMPILLPDKSTLTELIIRDCHHKVGHGGVYSTLHELRKQFWIMKYFSTVRRELKRCVVCRRFNELVES